MSQNMQLTAVKGGRDELSDRIGLSIKFEQKTRKIKKLTNDVQMIQDYNESRRQKIPSVLQSITTGLSNSQDQKNITKSLAQDSIISNIREEMITTNSKDSFQDRINSEAVNNNQKVIISVNHNQIHELSDFSKHVLTQRIRDSKANSMMNTKRRNVVISEMARVANIQDNEKLISINTSIIGHQNSKNSVVSSMREANNLHMSMNSRAKEAVSIPISMQKNQQFWQKTVRKNYYREKLTPIQCQVSSNIMDKQTIGSPSNMRTSPGMANRVLNQKSSFDHRGLTATGYMSSSIRPKANKIISIEGTQDFRLTSKGNTALGVFTPTQKNTIEPSNFKLTKRTISSLKVKETDREREDQTPQQSQRQSAMSQRSSVISRQEVKRDRVKVEANENQKKDELRFNDYLKTIEDLKKGEKVQYQDEINNFRRLINRSINMCENVHKKGMKKRPAPQMATMQIEDLKDQRQVLQSGCSSNREQQIISRNHKRQNIRTSDHKVRQTPKMVTTVSSQMESYDKSTNDYDIATRNLRTREEQQRFIQNHKSKVYNSLQFEKTQPKDNFAIKIQKGEQNIGDQLLADYFDLKDYNPMTEEDHMSSRLSKYQINKFQQPLSINLQRDKSKDPKFKNGRIQTSDYANSQIRSPIGSQRIFKIGAAEKKQSPFSSQTGARLRFLDPYRTRSPPKSPCCGVSQMTSPVFSATDHIPTDSFSHHLVQRLNFKQKQATDVVKIQLRKDFEIAQFNKNNSVDKTMRKDPIEHIYVQNFHGQELSQTSSIGSDKVIQEQIKTIKIDPIDSDTCPFNLAYKQNIMVKKFQKLNKSVFKKYAHLQNNRKPSNSSQKQQSKQRGSGAFDHETARTDLTMSDGQTPKASNVQNMTIRSGGTHANTRANQTLNNQTNLSFTYQDMNNMKKVNLKDLLPTKNELQDPDGKLLIRKNPKEMIIELDQKIQDRKNKLKIDIITDCVMKHREQQRWNKDNSSCKKTDYAAFDQSKYQALYDLDTYPKEVESFIKKRMKYKFKDKSSMVYEAMTTHSGNCGVQRIHDLQHIYRHNTIGDIQRGTLEKEVLKLEDRKLHVHEDTETPKDSKLIQYLSGPGFDIRFDQIDCEHYQSEDEFRRKYFEQYSMITKFIQGYEKKYQNHLSKNDVIEILQDKFYDMSDLTEEEQKIFGDPQIGLKLLLNPLLHLCKEELRQEKKSNAEKQEVVTLPFFDNSNQAAYKFDERIINTFQEDSDRYQITISNKMDEYLNDLDAVVTDYQPKGNHDEMPNMHQTGVMTKYEQVYENLRRDLVCLHHQTIDIGPLSNQKQLVSDRIQKAIDLKKQDIENVFGLNYNFNTWSNELSNQLERFVEEKLQKEGKDGFDPYDLMAYNEPQTQDLLSPKSSISSTSIVMRKPITLTQSKLRKVLNQAQIDLYENQEKKHQLFDSEYMEQKFWQFSKKYDNQYFENQNESWMLQILNEFHAQKAKPVPIFSHIKQNKLSLESTKMNEVEFDILTKFIEWTMEDPDFKVQHLAVKNCFLTPEQHLKMLTIFANQRRIISINLVGESLNKACMSQLNKCIEKPLKMSLQQLHLVKVNLSTDTLSAMFEQLIDQSFLSKFTLSQMPIFVNNKKAFEQFVLYMNQISEVADSSTNQQVMSHLELSYLSLSNQQLAKTVEALSYNKTLQFLSLRGNRMRLDPNDEQSEYWIHQFNEFLCNMLETNQRNLTHLDLSELVGNPEKIIDENKTTEDKVALKQINQLDSVDSTQYLKIDQILEILCETSKSLQTINLNDNFFTVDQKIQIAQKMGINDLEVLNHRFLKEDFLRKQEVLILNRLKTNQVIYRDEELTFKDRLLKDQLAKSVEKKKIDVKESSISEEAFFGKIQERATENTFTLIRNIQQNVSNYRYLLNDRGIRVPKLMVGDFWQMQIQKENKICTFSQNLQNISMFFNIRRHEDLNMGTYENYVQDFKQISGHKLKQILKSFILSQVRNLSEFPIIFGSFTNWEIYQMMPTHLHTVVLLKGQIVKEKDMYQKDQINHYLKALLNNLSSHRIKTIKGMTQEFTDMIRFANQYYNFEKMRNTNEFSAPYLQQNEDLQDSFYCEIQATPGQHSVYVFDPVSDRFYCREIMVDVRINAVDIGPKRTKYVQKYNKYGYDVFAAQKFEEFKSRDLHFLKDFSPITSTLTKSQFSQNIVQMFHRDYKVVNDLFIHHAANQTIENYQNYFTVLGDEDQEKIKNSTPHMQELLEPNKMYPCIQGQYLAQLFKTPLKSQQDRFSYYDRIQFLQIMMKKLQKDPNSIVDNTHAQHVKVNNLKNGFGFRQFEQFLNTIDPLTQNFLQINIKTFRAVFLKYSIDTQSVNQHNDESTYKSLGYMPLFHLRRILNLDSLKDVGLFMNHDNYLIKLKSAVGINLDYFSNDEQVSYTGVEKRRIDGRMEQIELKERQLDPEKFVMEMKNVPHYEQREIERDLQKKYSFQRSRFFNLDFMEFIQVILIHSVLVNQNYESLIPKEVVETEQDDVLSQIKEEKENDGGDVIYPEPTLLWTKVYDLLHTLDDFCIKVPKEENDEEPQPSEEDVLSDREKSNSKLHTTLYKITERSEIIDYMGQQNLLKQKIDEYNVRLPENWPHALDSIDFVFDPKEPKVELLSIMDKVKRKLANSLKNILTKQDQGPNSKNVTRNLNKRKNQTTQLIEIQDSNDTKISEQSGEESI